jgi:hypothetical protein
MSVYSQEEIREPSKTAPLDENGLIKATKQREFHAAISCHARASIAANLIEKKLE